MRLFIVYSILCTMLTGCEALSQPKSCKEPKINGNVPQTIINSAKIRCGFIYPRSPCVESITERGKNNYWVICVADPKKEGK